MRATSSLTLRADPGARDREREELDRKLREADAAAERARLVAAKVERVTRLYRERLEGTRRSAT